MNCSVCSVMWQCCGACSFILWHTLVEMADIHMFSSAYGCEFAAHAVYQYTLPGHWIPDRYFVALVSTLGKEGTVESRSIVFQGSEENKRWIWGND
jgi:hypothetical protein